MTMCWEQSLQSGSNVSGILTAVNGSSNSGLLLVREAGSSKEKPRKELVTHKHLIIFIFYNSRLPLSGDECTCSSSHDLVVGKSQTLQPPATSSSRPSCSPKYSSSSASSKRRTPCFSRNRRAERCFEISNASPVRLSCKANPVPSFPTSLAYLLTARRYSFFLRSRRFLRAD